METEKQPWEMTDTEFTDYYNKVGFENGMSKLIEKNRERIRKEHNAEYFRDIPEYKLTQKEYIEGHRSGWTVILGKRGEYTKELAIADHKAFVEEALSEGAPVPAEVLKNYAGEKWANDALALMPKKPKPVTPQVPSLKSEIAKRAQEQYAGWKGKPPIVKQPAIPKELEPLAEEAKKYKSAEEWKKAIAEEPRGRTLLGEAPLGPLSLKGSLVNQYGFKTLASFYSQATQTKPSTIKVQAIPKEQKPTPVKPAERQPWEMTREEYLQQSYALFGRGNKESDQAVERFHKQHVDLALAEDKPVSRNVLDDCPDLTRRA